MSKIFKIIFSFSMLFLLNLSPNTALALDPPETGSPIENPLGEKITTPDKLLTRVIKWLLGISGLIAMLSLIYGGIRFMLAAGNESSIKEAKNILLWSIVGLAVIILSFVIVSTVERVLVGSEFSLINTAHAQTSLEDPTSPFEADGGPVTSGIDSTEFNLPERTAEGVIIGIINWVLGIAGLLAVGAVIWGGVRYITALGNETQVAKAKMIILYAVLGVIIVLGSFAIIRTVESLLTDEGAMLVQTAHAQEKKGFDANLDSLEEATGLEGDTGVAGVIINVVNAILALGAVLALAAIVIGGVFYVISLGNENNVARAKRIIIYAILGLLFMGGSFAIIATVRTIFASDVLIQPAYAQEKEETEKEDITFDGGFDAVDSAAADAGISADASEDLPTLILAVVRVIMSILAVLALGAIIVGAGYYIISTGNDQRIETAKKIILYAIVGLIVSGISVLIVNLVLNFFSGAPGA